jgi:hypothetical protein
VSFCFLTTAWAALDSTTTIWAPATTSGETEPGGASSV